MAYDDNFGEYDMGDSWQDREDTMEFYRHVQQNSVMKTCSICGRRVKLMPDYDKCDSCCRDIESGRCG
jgi:hypothetical protein